MRIITTISHSQQTINQKTITPMTLPMYHVIVSWSIVALYIIQRSLAMRIMVIGGDGYLGWPTALHLSQRGHDVAIRG
jgi:NADPH-dependent 2,4-dienoyl-CoA reductase/sulfur reductase-like enzyme